MCTTAAAARFQELQQRGDDYQVVVIEGTHMLGGCHNHHLLADVDKHKVIGTATMLVELKFLRGCGKVRWLALDT